jgi:hypothetical protein
MAVAKVALHTNEGKGCMAKSHYDKIAVISGGANGIGQALRKGWRRTGRTLSSPMSLRGAIQ